MSTTLLAIALALGSASEQDGKLAITDVRFTYGFLGPSRPAEFLPGEKVFMAYNVRNMKIDDKGRVEYTLSMKVISPDGKELIKQKPLNKVALNYLGGPLMPSMGKGDIPLDMPPGDYTLVLTLEDLNAKQTASTSIKAKVLSPNFGIIHVEPSADSQGMVPTAPIGVLGQTLFVNFAMVGFDRDKDKKQPHISVSLRLLDKAGKATMPMPLTGKASENIPEAFRILPLQFAFTLNRTGTFTVELNAKDEMTGKTSQVTFPIQVLSVK
jgi:hypothetical protein